MVRLSEQPRSVKNKQCNKRDLNNVTKQHLKHKTEMHYHLQEVSLSLAAKAMWLTRMSLLLKHGSPALTTALMVHLCVLS